LPTSFFLDDSACNPSCVALPPPPPRAANLKRAVPADEMSGKVGVCDRFFADMQV
jgi:hypothetical protein